MKRVGVLVLLFFLCLRTTVFAAEPNVGAAGAALIDGDSGRLLWGKDEERQLAMASTTKIMTAVLVLELVNLEDIVTISRHAASQPEVNMNLVLGEEWYAGDLLKVMMLRSYNDAAVALAEYVGGSEAEFCRMMTEKAAEIGAGNTVFGSPNGLDSHLTDEEHHSTAYDMSLIAMYAMENEGFREIAALSEITIREVNGKREQHASNANRLLREYMGALGVKTGYTNKAGHCFVAAAERDGVFLISTVLASGWGERGKEGKWTDTRAILDYGFENFSLHEIIRAGSEAGRVAVAHSEVAEIGGIYGDGYEALFSEEEMSKIVLRNNLPERMEAPVMRGAYIGEVEIWLDEAQLAVISISASEEAPPYGLEEWFSYLNQNWLTWHT